MMQPELPRLRLPAVNTHIKPNTFAMFQNNPEEFISKVI